MHSSKRVKKGLHCSLLFPWVVIQVQVVLLQFSNSCREIIVPEQSKGEAEIRRVSICLQLCVDSVIACTDLLNLKSCRNNFVSFMRYVFCWSLSYVMKRLCRLVHSAGGRE